MYDPVHTQINAVARPDEPWNGEFYASFGHGEERAWDDALEFGFICGGAWYSKTLQLLAPNDRVWVKVPKTGFVGVARVTGRAQPLTTFTVDTPEGPRPVLEAATRADYLKEFENDPERCEYFVPVSGCRPFR